ncbi:molecular chaperone [Pseudomonas palleroniana]|uniref:Molecular chaperone n=1 Tax=Pseudomonas palleroniana TaxID=191390 RepID=A0A1H5ND22_9PSED|nr:MULTISPECIES: molecular chaperone [Pseudomonas]KAB0569854.1 molecular chaperone [Pseudomonas palleroniana]MBI6909588.1 molecular chaperone [Pseudomonas palleroniana]MBM9484886.1 molecular chaperone [Pseudomonas sp. ICBG1301]PTC31377.1 molecular chaperone [Pseudomonas palleroniana]UOK40626.1 molecular chaperone [Pseudomonas palleroniana]
MLPRSIAACLGLLGMLMATQAGASISLNATRIVFDGDHKEANITVRNGNQDVLVQSWVDMNDAGASRAPFAVTPPLARVFAKEQQLLRVLYEGTGMPTDRESVVWLNVQEIPKASEAENTLQLAIRQRIKIFYRPAGLPGSALQAPAQLEWTLVRQGAQTLLSVKNPTLYHVSMADIKVQAQLASDSTMIAPGEHKQFALGALPTSGPVQLSFYSINDYGAQNHYTTPLSSGVSAPAHATESRLAP